MHNLPFTVQIQKIGQLAATRHIKRNDPYLEVYPGLLQGFQALPPLNQETLLLTAHAVFGWMPTQLRVDMRQLDYTLVILKGILQNGAQASVNDLDVLASTFRTVKGNSVVAASKILHFLAPRRFPIWDGQVAKKWGLQPSGPQAPANYHGFTVACRRFAWNANGRKACRILRKHLSQSGYHYPMTVMRLIELMFFLPP